MLGIRTILKSNTNTLNIRIPDAMKGKELEVIIIQTRKAQNDTVYEFWNEEELQHLGKINLGSQLKDKEDYSKW